MAKEIDSRFSEEISEALNILVNNALLTSTSVVCEDETHNEKLRCIYDQMADLGEHGCQAFVTLLEMALTIGIGAPEYATALLDGLLVTDNSTPEKRAEWLAQLMKKAPMTGQSAVEDTYIKPTPFDAALREIVGEEKEKE